MPSSQEQTWLNHDGLTGRSGRYEEQHQPGGRTGTVNSYGPCGDVRQALGVYVLGAMEPADRALVERHLASCLGCTEELAGLAGIPALLRRVPPTEATAPAVEKSGGDRMPDPTLASLLSRVAKVRRRRLVAVGAAAVAAAAIAIGGAVAGLRAEHSSAGPQAVFSPRQSTAASAVNPRTHATAIIWYAPTAWGLQLAVRVSGIPAGTTCELKVISRRGQTFTAGGWTIASSPGTWYPASAALPPSEVRSFIVTAGMKILVRVPLR